MQTESVFHYFSRFCHSYRSSWLIVRHLDLGVTNLLLLFISQLFLKHNSNLFLRVERELQLASFGLLDIYTRFNALDLFARTSKSIVWGDGAGGRGNESKRCSLIVQIQGVPNVLNCFQTLIMMVTLMVTKIYFNRKCSASISISNHVSVIGWLKRFLCGNVYSKRKCYCNSTCFL